MEVDVAANLLTDEQLRESSSAAFERFQNQPGYRAWEPKLAEHIAKVQDANESEFKSLRFQQNLWESESVSATGMGTVDVSKVIQSSQVVQLLWELRNLELPKDRLARTEVLRASWETLASAVDPLVSGRRPRLKMYRVFAALFPTDFTTIAHVNKLKRLAKAMGIGETASKHAVVLHSDVLTRLESALGKVPAAPAAEGVKRMSLPWLLFAAFIQERGDEATTIDDPAAGTEELNPLPAARRRRGLLAIAGYLPSIRSMIQFAKDGCTREDFREHIHSINPKLSPSSIGTNINALIAEWGAISAMGDNITLTPRGESLLETGDAAEVSDWLLTRILGFDFVLAQLRNSPTSQRDLVALLQKLNTEWKTSFTSTVLVRWIVRLGLAESGEDKLLALTPEGQIWSKRIHWSPEGLAGVASDSPLSDERVDIAQPKTKSARPTFEEIYAAFPKTESFPKQLVARLDAGLWHNSRRHFAILTGLSGAGKTMLARRYGHALWVGEESPQDGTYVLPVQPGWSDSTAIMGYVNPLVEDVYMRTGFLDFLLRAAGDPARPYTLVLDEMNLSHPEQYLAPLLSTMETGDAIEFHTSDEELSGVPPRIAYPSNLVIIGTVNMDETTHGISDKILDRACVLDFWKVDIDAFPGWDAGGLSAASATTVRNLLIGLSQSLEPARLHFGWRTVADVIGFVRSSAEAGILNEKQSLDHAIYGKILPKLRGEDTQRVRDAFNGAATVLKAADLQDSASKLSELLDDLKQTGSARFWR